MMNPTFVVTPRELSNARATLEKMLPDIPFQDLCDGKVIRMINGQNRVAYVQPHYYWPTSTRREIAGYEVSCAIFHQMKILSHKGAACTENRD